MLKFFLPDDGEATANVGRQYLVYKLHGASGSPTRRIERCLQERTLAHTHATAWAREEVSGKPGGSTLRRTFH